MVVVGMLSVVSVTLFNNGFVGPTLASWNDRVLSSIRFGLGDGALVPQGYARAQTASVSGLYPRDYAAGELATRTVTKDLSNRGTEQLSLSNLPFNRSGTVLPELWIGNGLSGPPVRGCASYGAYPDRSCAGVSDGTLLGEARAGATDVRLGSWQGNADNRLFISSVDTSVTCRAGNPYGLNAAAPSVSGLSIANRSIGPGHDAYPPASGRKDFDVRLLLSDIRLRGTWEVTASTNATRAVSSIRLTLSEYLSSLSSTPVWTVSLNLAHSECGVGTNTPTVSPWSTLSALRTLLMPIEAPPSTDGCATEPVEEAAPRDHELDPEVEEPAGEFQAELGDRENEPVCTLTPIESLIDEGIVGEADLLPETEATDRIHTDGDDRATDADDSQSVTPDAAKSTDSSASEVEGSASEPTEGPEVGDAAPPAEEVVSLDGDKSPIASDATGVRNDSDQPDDTESSGAPVSKPSVPIVNPPVEETAIPTPVSSGPTSPMMVRQYSEFPIVTPGGAHLATVTIKDVTHTAGCGVAVRLQVTVSGDLENPLSGLRSRDFREVLADGGTAPVTSAGSECDTGASLPSTFEPGETYSGWVEFGVANGGTSVMLRPSGTAGWIFDLPAMQSAATSVAPVAPSTAVTEPDATEEEVVVTMPETTQAESASGE